MEARRIIEKPLHIARHVGGFVVEQLTGGGWSNLPHAEPRPAVRPVRASIQHLSTPESGAQESEEA